LGTEKKKGLVADLHSRFAQTEAAILLDFRGLTVTEMTALRRLLRTEGAELKVVKNTLARRALKGTIFEILEDGFSGPTSVALCEGDIVAPAKVLREFSRGREGLKVIGGLFEGRFISSKEVDRVATLPPRDVLLAQLLGGLQAPMGGLVRLLQGFLSQLVWTLAAIRDKGGSPPPSGTGPEQEEAP
jgi:large subunit ribosomal protein L10